MGLPNFIIIGAMKCGTTVLWRNLDQHPDITMGKNYQDPKKTSTEIRFFNNAKPYRNWEKGLDWYKTCFKGDFGGEKCANYIDSKKAMKRIHDIVPQTKLILCARNPVDRAYSEYYMQLSTSPDKNTRGFDYAIVRNTRYQNRGKYFEMLKLNVLPFFPKEQIYVVIQERMINNTETEMNKLYDFLGVPHFSTATQEVNFKDRDSQVEGYRKWRSDYRSAKPMSKPIRKWLRKFYAPHNKRLFDFLGYKVEEWAE